MGCTKPNMAYKGRMKREDAHWVIWSNKWGCWYRANSSGYTSDALQAGIYTRAEAVEHYHADSPRSHRDTEPFPLSILRKEATRAVAVAKADLLAAEQRLELISNRVPS